MTLMQIGRLLPLVLCLQSAMATPFARIVITGEHRLVDVGQDGYCGERKTVPLEARRSIFVEGGVRTWVQISNKRLRDTRVVEDCGEEISFVPEAGTVYGFTLVFHSLLACQIKVYKTAPNIEPVPVSVEVESARSCLFEKPASR
jgi:hypothetical protein